MKWIRCIDELPVIPEKRFGVQVIVATFDPCYEECSSIPDNGYSVQVARYAIIDYEKMPMFKGSVYPDGSPAFTEQYVYGKDNSTEWGLMGDRVTHWMYMPEAPRYDAEVLNPIYQWYHDHAVPQSPLKQLPVITRSDWDELCNRT